ERKRFIARERSYQGNTLGALSVSGFLERRRPFEGSLLDVSFVSAANAYRPLRGLAGEQLVAALADELDASIRAAGPERVAAFIFEPVVGAAGGAVPAPPGYAQAVRAVCDRHGVLIIADEVMSGAGRCGTWRALEHDAVVPDVMAVGKGLAGGYIPRDARAFPGRAGLEPVNRARRVRGRAHHLSLRGQRRRRQWRHRHRGAALQRKRSGARGARREAHRGDRPHTRGRVTFSPGAASA